MSATIRTVSMNHSSVSPPSTATAFDQAVQLATQSSKRNLKLKREDSKVEELVLKRCWLARYWGLAAKLGVYAHIAHKKHAVWAAFAPIPLEVVISAGQKAKALATERPPIKTAKSAKDAAATDESSGRAHSTCGGNSEDEMNAEGEEESGIESQLLMAEEGMKELADLRVEEAVLLKISQNQNPALIWLGLSREQAQDIQFKQAWLVHCWRRAQPTGVVEQDVAADRLFYWMNRTDKPPAYQDAVDVHRGLLELQTLGFHSQEDRLHGHECLKSLHNNVNQNLSNVKLKNPSKEIEQHHEHCLIVSKYSEESK